MGQNVLTIPTDDLVAFEKWYKDEAIEMIDGKESMGGPGRMPIKYILEQAFRLGYRKGVAK